MNPIELGKFIANLRNEKHLTQEELAEKLFIDKRKVSRWECGTSMPEFDMLIKLSKILDVSLYELSICKRIDNEKISKRLLNKFKDISDIKKYSLRRKVINIIFIIFMVFFILTTIYTIKYYGTIEIYSLDSLDKNYVVEGNYIKVKDYYIINIIQINNIEDGNTSINSNNCYYEVYNEDNRLYNLTNNKKNITSNSYYYDEITNNYKIQDTIIIKMQCQNKKSKIDNYEIKVKLNKKFDNKLF